MNASSINYTSSEKIMIQFTATIKRFKDNAEKTGWTYIEVPSSLATQLMPGNKKGFRVKGMLDNYSFEGASLLPMGGGDFILTLNASKRKKIKKGPGYKLQVKLEVDAKPILPPKELMDCLADEPEALARFKKLTRSHQNYFTNWINTAKTAPTKAKRIAASINALANGFGFVEAIRSLRKDRMVT
jgi:hypothetical protein